MLNFFLTCLAFILATATFTFSYSYSGVSRTFIGFGKSIAEVNIIQTDSSGEYLDVPYFDVESFETMTNKYFRDSLRRYLGKDQSYTLSYYYYDAFEKDMPEDTSFPTGIKLSFECPISYFGTYKNQMHLAIREGNNHA